MERIEQIGGFKPRQVSQQGNSLGGELVQDESPPTSRG